MAAMQSVHCTDRRGQVTDSGSVALRQLANLGLAFQRPIILRFFSIKTR
jgi:hypothetical protein